MAKIFNKNEVENLLKNFKLRPLLDLSGYFIYCYGLMHFFSKSKKYQNTTMCELNNELLEIYTDLKNLQ